MISELRSTSTQVSVIPISDCYKWLQPSNISSAIYKNEDSRRAVIKVNKVNKVLTVTDTD